MPEVTTFMLSDRADQLPGTMQLVNPIPSLRPLYIPGAFSFMMSIGIAGLDLDVTYKISMKIVSPSGQVAYNMPPVALPMDQLRNTIPDDKNCDLMLNIDVRNMPISEAGKYVLKASLNGEELDERSIFVRGV